MRTKYVLIYLLLKNFSISMIHIFLVHVKISNLLSTSCSFLNWFENLKHKGWSTWVAQLVKAPTHDFGSGHDLTFSVNEPDIQLCTESMESA